LRLFLFF